MDQNRLDAMKKLEELKKSAIPKRLLRQRRMKLPRECGSRIIQVVLSDLPSVNPG
jgi:hypothetical protein